MYGLSNFEQELGVVSQKRDSSGNRIHDPDATSLDYYQCDLFDPFCPFCPFSQAFSN